MSIDPARRRNLIRGIAGLLVVAALGLVLYARSAPGAVPTPAGGHVSVLLAQRDLAAGTQVGADAFRVGSVPADAAPAGAQSDPKAVIGKYLTVAVPRDGVITGSAVDINPPGPLNVREGFAAVPVPFDVTGALGTFISPGERIDILVDASPGSAAYAVQNVRVLRVVVQTAGPGGPGLPGLRGAAAPTPAGGSGVAPSNAGSSTSTSGSQLIVEVRQDQVAALVAATGRASSAIHVVLRH